MFKAPKVLHLDLVEWSDLHDSPAVQWQRDRTVIRKTLVKVESCRENLEKVYETFVLLTDKSFLKRVRCFV